MNASSVVRFCLYVAGETPNSTLARSNLVGLCARYLPGRHTIEVVNVLTDAARAVAANVYLTPTLVRLAPEPIRQIVGNLSRTHAVLEALGLSAVAA